MARTAGQNSRSIEMRNRLNLINIAYEEGYVAYLPVVDEGIDFILFREVDQNIIKAQLKGRWTIDKKYLDRDIRIAFPDGDKWYLAPHEAMVEMAENLKFAPDTRSWKEQGTYSKAPMGAKLRDAMKAYIFPSRN